MKEKMVYFYYKDPPPPLLKKAGFNLGFRNRDLLSNVISSSENKPHELLYLFTSKFLYLSICFIDYGVFYTFHFLLYIKIDN